MTVYAPSDEKSYVFYSIYENDPAETDRNKRQAEIIQKEYSGTYGGCEVIGVNSAQEFVDQWNKLPDSVGAIQVISHGHVNYKNENANDYLNGYIFFSDGSKLYSSSFNVMGSNDRSVDNLKTMSANKLYFSACNTANKDFKTNIAKAFYEKNNISQVTGWDGGVTFIFKSKNPFFKVNRDYSVEEGGDVFKELCKDGREPGKITYGNRSGSHGGGGSHR